MIISTKNHMEKMAITRSTKALVDGLTNCQLDSLPKLLLENLQWERPRGDLYHWIPLLNRFDEIFKDQISKYELDQDTFKFQEISAEDKELVIACLRFTTLLLEHCANRSIYSSTDRMYRLIDMPVVDIKLHALEVCVALSERYVHKTSGRYQVPKELKMNVLKLAKFFPPRIPPNYETETKERITAGETHDHNEISKHHYTLIQSIRSNQYPSQWKLLHFQYYRTTSLPMQQSVHAKSETESLKKSTAQKAKSVSSGSSERNTEGLATFNMSEDNVRKYKVQQIYSKASEVTPKEVWFDLSLAVLIAKAYCSNEEASKRLREKLLCLKCLAVSFICCACPTDFTASRYFEAEPHIFNYVTQLVQPENMHEIPEYVILSAIKTLQCISLKRVWGSDLIRSLGGNVNHGVLYQFIRFVHSKIVTHKDSYSEEVYVHYFNMVGNMLESKSLTPRLTAGGILGELMSFFGVNTDYKWTASAAINLITLYLSSSPDSFENFVQNNGFGLIIETLGRELESALRDSSSSNDESRESMSCICFKQASYIKSILKLTSHLIQSESGDRLRGLFDSPILQCFNLVLNNSSIFGPSISSLTLDCISYIIHNDPIAYPILKEAGAVDTIINVFPKLLLPSSDVLMSLPEAVGAICLNNEGLDKVMKENILPTYFNLFYDLESSKELVRSDMSTNLGCSFDELGRHYPPLKPVIVEEIKKIIESLPDVISSNFTGASYYESEKGSLYTSKSQEIIENEEGAQEIANWDINDGAYLADNTLFFLGGLLQDSGQWSNEAMRAISFHSFSRFLELKNAPFDYTMSNGFSTLMGILKYFDDENRDYGLPVLYQTFKRKVRSEAIQKYIHYELSEQSYFDLIGKDSSSATLLIKDLNELNTFLYTLGEIYVNTGLMFHERYSQIAKLFGFYESSDKDNATVIESLALLFKRSVLEDSIIRSRTPDTVLQQTLPTSEIASDLPPIHIFASEPANKTEKQDFTSAVFKNTLQLRFLAYRFQNYVGSLFCCLARVCMHKRQEYNAPDWRRDAVYITNELGRVLTGLVRSNITNEYHRSCYFLVVLNMCLSCLNQKERINKEALQTSLAISLFQEGFFDCLTELGVFYWDVLLHLNPEDVAKTNDLKYISTAPASIVKNLLSQIFIILLKVVNNDTPNIPAARLYYRYGYSKDPELFLVPAFLAQTRLVAFSLLSQLMGSSSLLSSDRLEIQVQNIPSALIDQLINITKQIWMAKKENADVKFVRLSTENVSPPLFEIEVFQSWGILESTSEYVVKNFDIFDISESEFLKAINLEDDEKAQQILLDVRRKVSDVVGSLTLPNTGKDLQARRSESSGYFIGHWMNIARLYPDSVNSISELFLSTTNNPKQLSNEIFGFVVDTEHPSDSSYEGFRVVVQILRVVLRNEEVAYSSREVFSKFVDIVIPRLETRSSDINGSFVSNSLEILQQLICYKNIPIANITTEDLSGELNVPCLIEDDCKERIFNCILSFKERGILNIDTAIGVVKILILFTVGEEHIPAILRSNILGVLIHKSQDYFASKAKNCDTYQASLIILLRRVFENRDVVKSNMAVELSSIFRRSVRGKRELHSILKDTGALVMRNPDQYVDTISKDLVVENYDGSEHIPSRLNVSKHKEEQEDTQMMAVDQPKGPENTNIQNGLPTTGIVHSLLSELMDTNKKDWVCDKDAKESEKEKKKVTSAQVFANPNFSYMCFLFQALTELLGSYKQPKLEFLTFSKKQSSGENLKPRSTALNFFIHQLIQSKSLIKSSGIESERRSAISSLAKLSLLSLVSTPILDEENLPSAKKENIDMSFIRKFYVDILLKVLKETASYPCASNVRYSKLMDLFDICGCLLSHKFRELAGPLLNKDAVKYDLYYIVKALIDKQIPTQITSILSGLDLNFPDIHRVSKFGLRSLTLIGKVRSESHDLFEEDNQGEKDDEDEEPDDYDDRDETPDFFRHSTLGMYDMEYDSEGDEGDYFDDGEQLEVLMSGDDISEDTDNESDLSPANEEEDDDNDDDVSPEGSVADYSDSHPEDGHPGVDDDIEIIDELEIPLGEEEGENVDYSDLDYFDGNPDDEEGYGEGWSDYDDDELDGWIEEFEDDVPSDTENLESGAQDDITGIESVRRNRHDNSGIRFDGLDTDESEEEGQPDGDDESIIDDENDGVAPVPDTRRRARDFATSFFDALRPAIVQPNITSLFEGLFNAGNNDNDNELLRGTIHITNPMNGSHIQRPLGNWLQVGSSSRPEADVLSSMYIKSTGERWVDSYNMFSSYYKEEHIMRIIPSIVEKVKVPSLELNKKKKDEAEKQKREREEKIRKKEEEERRRREERAKEREASASNQPATEPIMVRIGDREVDISGTDIDPEFFEALPDDMREEVFTQYVRERRANASSNGVEAREIDPDFLEALPEQIREEILQQESIARRFSGIDDNLSYGDDDNDHDLEGEEDDEISSRPLDIPNPFGASDSRSRRSGSEDMHSKRVKKSFYTPLIDKFGVASLIRLLFVPQVINQREYVHQCLLQICNNKQTRSEVMSLLIAILYNGFFSHRSVEKIFSQVSSRANAGMSKSSKESRVPPETSPITLGYQVAETMLFLLENNTHMRYYLLREHENSFIVRKSTLKNRPNEPNKGERFQLNFLLRLLENEILREEEGFMDILARIVQLATRPLHTLQKANVEKEDSKPPMSIPIIPEYNLRQLIKILSSDACPNTTLRKTISAMHNLSSLPGAQRIFSLELSNQAGRFGNIIICDLRTLTAEIKKTENYSTEDRAFSKFDISCSHQAKLLRLLTALDYMFESREREREGKRSEGHKEMNDANNEKEDDIEELTSLYKRLALGSLWDALSECLLVLENKPEMTNIATTLLPLIEALMVVCKHCKVRGLPMKDSMKYEAKKVDFSKEPIESLFYSFTDEHKKILNQMVRTNPNLMSGPFGMLVRNPGVLEFDNKKSYFDRKLHEDQGSRPALSISVRRSQVFLDSYRALFFKSKDEFKNSKLEVNFRGESGIDAGGVTREWYQVLSRQMFNPDYALFIPVASDETTFHPNRTSYVNPEHLSFFKFIGKMISKAIFDNCFLDCHFSRAVYKRILGKPVSLKDMETLDLGYFKSLIWMLENDITDVITEDFSVETDDYGEHKIIDLVPNGRNIAVTEDNKQEYVRLVVEYRLQESVTEQMENFLQGFHEIIPRELISIFDEQELELLISGLPDIDVNDWQNNTIYVNYSPSSIQIQWFWRAVMSFDNEERAKLLQFATGTSKVPLNGFKEMTGANGICKFSIHRDYGSTDRLPSSHTCFNQIDLPAYDSYETLRGSLLLAVTEGHEGFGFA